MAGRDTGGDKTERLAAALRANLRRRKQQARAGGPDAAEEAVPTAAQDQRGSSDPAA